MAPTEPQDVTAEQIVIGAALLDAGTLPVVELNPDHFYRPVHGLIWRYLCDAYGAGDPTDMAAIAARMLDAGDLSRAGGAGYLHTCVEAVPTTANAGYYAGRVRELARRRELSVVATRIGILSESGADADTATAMARGWLDNTDPAAWPDPAPLVGNHRLPEFPADALPAWMAGYVAAVAEFTQVPTDLPACLALACLSAAAGGKTLVEVKPGWIEPVNIFTIVAMPPGTRKTPVFRAMIRPIKQAEKALKEAAKPRIIEARTALKAAQATAEKTAGKIAGTNTPETMAEAVDAALAAESITIPVEPELIADDVTAEAAASIMAAQGGRLAILAPEGGLLGNIAGRYGGGPNFDFLLRGHGGDDLTVGRQTRDRQVIERASLTLGLCLQPSVLRELYQIPQAVGKGLPARMLYCLPADNVGYRNTSPASIPPAIADAYDTELRALTITLANLPDTATVPFSPAASAAITALMAEVEPKLRPGGEWAHVRDWGNKWAGSVVARIAGLLHVANHLRDGWTQPVSVDTVHTATTIGRYFAIHALAAFDTMGADPITDHARAALDWIQRNQPHQFTKREMFRGIYRSRFHKVDELDPILDLLEQSGYIRRLPEPERAGRGRKPSPTYLTHPHIVRPPLHAVPGTEAAGTAS